MRQRQIKHAATVLRTRDGSSKTSSFVSRGVSTILEFIVSTRQAREISSFTSVLRSRMTLGERAADKLRDAS
jgi:hypothetical protein